MDTRTLGGSFLAGIIAAFIVGVALTAALADVVWPSVFVGIFVGSMTGIVVFAAFYLFFRENEDGLSEPAGGIE